MLERMTLEPNEEAAVLIDYARELCGDPEHRRTAERLLRRASVKDPLLPEPLALLGRQLMARGETQSGLEALRFAACLQKTDEDAALEYFVAARQAGEGGEWLQVAVAPIIIGSGRPAFTLPAVARLAEAQRPPCRRFEMGEDVLFDFDLQGEGA